MNAAVSSCRDASLDACWRSSAAGRLMETITAIIRNLKKRKNYETVFQADRQGIRLFRTPQRSAAIDRHPAGDHQLHPAVHLWAGQCDHWQQSVFTFGGHHCHLWDDAGVGTLVPNHLVALR